VAAELADAHIVGLLLKSNVDITQKNSAGKTALQVAEGLNRKGSHAEAVRALPGEVRLVPGGHQPEPTVEHPEPLVQRVVRQHVAGGAHPLEARQ